MVLVLLWGARLVFLREANTVAACQWTSLARSLGRGGPCQPGPWKQRPSEPLPKPRAGFLLRLIPLKRKRMAQLLCVFFRGLYRPGSQWLWHRSLAASGRLLGLILALWLCSPVGCAALLWA